MQTRRCGYENHHLPSKKDAGRYGQLCLPGASGLPRSNRDADELDQRTFLQGTEKALGLQRQDRTGKRRTFCGNGSPEKSHARNLYDFWGDSLYREVLDESGIIINLASREYSQCIEKHLSARDRFITCVFGELENGKVVQKGVYAKMARGDMVRFMAEIGASDPEQLKTYDRCCYHFDEARSTDKEYVFIRTEIPGRPRR